MQTLSIEPVEAISRMKFWASLAELKDTYGLPSDIIWCKLRDAKHPIAKENSSEDFAKHIDTMIQWRQSGFLKANDII